MGDQERRHHGVAPGREVQAGGDGAAGYCGRALGAPGGQGERGETETETERGRGRGMVDNSKRYYLETNTAPCENALFITVLFVLVGISFVHAMVISCF